MRLLLLLAVVLVASFGVWALYGSDWFRAERVSVSGTRALTEKQVRDAAAVPVGSPLASLDEAAVEHRLRERLRRIDRVRVERSWPHEVSVEVTERKPVLVLEHSPGRADGSYVEVDDDGVRFGTLDKRPKDVPLLSLEPRAPADARHFSDSRLRRAAARVAESLPESLARETRGVLVRSYDDISLRLTDGRTVLWGSADGGAAKAEALAALRKAEKDAEHFDVSVPRAPSAVRS
nr:FtsQ-type POTRA domain-containing protein [Streptomyces oceani]